MKLKTLKFKNKLLSNVIRDSLGFYLNNLLPESKTKRLTIKVVSKPNIAFDASCEKTGRFQYLIEVKSAILDDIDLLLISLAHETVHIKQYTTKELSVAYTKHEAVDVWKGKRYRETNYDNQPWEKEAYDAEQNLYINYLSACYANGFISKIVTLNSTKTAG